jgi:hypothetical protein
VLERAAGAQSADGGWTDIERPDAEDEEIAVTGFLRRCDTDEERTDSSLVAFHRAREVVKNVANNGVTPTTVFSPVQGTCSVMTAPILQTTVEPEDPEVRAEDL